MRLNTVDERASRANESPVRDREPPPTLLTPARRAALDALEREFFDLLHARPA